MRTKPTIIHFVALLVLLMTAATGWATTTSTINVGGTDYTLFTGFTATDGTSGTPGSNYEKLVDGDMSSVFLVLTSSAYIEFNADDLIVPRGYIFNSDDDYYVPTSWVLKAKTSAADSWTTISSESDNSSSKTEFIYSCNSEGDAYRYFRFEVTRSGQTVNDYIRMTEIRLYGSTELPANYHSVTIADAVSGLISSEPNKAKAGSTVTLTLSQVVDESTLSVNDGEVGTTDIGNRQYTFTMPVGNVTVTATARATYSVNLPANMEIVSTTIDADGNGKYIEGTVVTFKPSLPYTASNVSDGTNTLTADGDGNYSVTVGSADITVTATVERNSNIDLSHVTLDYTAIDGDVLTGSTSHAVTIAAGAGITLSNATITGGIVCEGSATIALVGTNSVTGSRYKAGIQVGGEGTTLTIRGDGSLTATGGLEDNAGIGTSYAKAVDVTGGDIVIDGGNITAIGGGNSGFAAGIGTGHILGSGQTESESNTARLGNITIRCGKVTAVGGTKAAGIGKGLGNASYIGHAVIGKVTIYDGVDMVDATSISESVTYMHGETDVTASVNDYFNITEDGDRRIISPKDDTEYDITINEGITGGTVTADKPSAKYGEMVTLTVSPDSDKRLNTLTVKDSNNSDVTVTKNRFFMPKSAVTVNATFLKKTASLDETTGVLTLIGNVDADEVKAYRSTVEATSPVTSVVCETGAVFPADCSELFYLFGNVVTIDLCNADMSGVTNMNRMFWKCENLTTIYVSPSWSIENVTNYVNTFFGCSKLTGGGRSIYESICSDLLDSYDYEYDTDAAWSGAYAVIDGKDGQRGYLTVVPKVTPKVTPPEPIPNLAYTGEPMPLIMPATSDYGWFTYSFYPNEFFASTIPVAGNSRTYTVYYKLDGCNNWDEITGTVEVTIAPKPVTNENITNTGPAAPIALTQDQHGTTATLDGASEGSVSITADVDVDDVKLSRVFVNGQKTAICWPFEVSASEAAALGKFYEFNGINGDGKIEMQEVTSGLAANTPYIFEPSNNKTEIDFGAKTLKQGGPAQVGSGYTYKGIYSRVKWTTDTSDPLYNTEANRKDELGKAYGFALEEITVGETTYHKGQFVKLGSGAHSRAFRAYLLYDGTWDGNQPTASARTRGGGLPDVLDIVWLGASGSTTGISSIGISHNGDAWYSIDGRKLSGKPSQRGVYINKGKKVVIK